MVGAGRATAPQGQIAPRSLTDELPEQAMPEALHRVAESHHRD
jgi:hypothetical protein